MTWLGVIAVLSQVALGLVNWLVDRGKIDAAQAQIIAKALQDSLDGVARARAAVGAVSDDPAVVRNDPDNRDGRS